MAQQILGDFMGQGKASGLGVLRKRLRFFGVGKPLHLIHQPPAQASAQVGAQREIERCLLAADQQHSAIIAYPIVNIE